MSKKSYYLVMNRKSTYWGCGDVIKGEWVYRAPFHPTDNTKVYCIGGYALGIECVLAMIKLGKIKRISRKKAIDILLGNIR